ncbi:hypothetical protein BN988_03321 [Oceanobacillus picturae]|uniref:Uncharacterized protein n=1 Tax=Oceanobacillus picturae TaxID=171693 RepID=W9AGB3_9BACI|nr:hypothetical protein BN988_03321 [Oceanobacillus picturae]
MNNEKNSVSYLSIGLGIIAVLTVLFTFWD